MWGWVVWDHQWGWVGWDQVWCGAALGLSDMGLGAVGPGSCGVGWLWEQVWCWMVLGLGDGGLGGVGPAVGGW